MRLRILGGILFVWFVLFGNYPEVSGWSNGGDSANPADPDYGTHDWIAETALKFLPEKDRAWLEENMVAYLIGTEAPDNSKVALPYTDKDDYGDKSKNHHDYYDMEHTKALDNAACQRAQEEYGKALTALKNGDYKHAAFYAGAMTHYIADVAVWAHVRGKGSPHGSESSEAHREYETAVNNTIKAKRYSGPNHTSSVYQNYIVFDGTYNDITAYQASYQMGLDTDKGGVSGYDCVRMEVEWKTAQKRTGESLNLAVNYITDVLYRLNQEAGLAKDAGVKTTGDSAPTPTSSAPNNPATSEPDRSLTYIGGGVGLLILLGIIMMRKKKGRN